MGFTVFDAHCDTIAKLVDFGGELRKNSYHFDFNRIQKSGRYIQVFAAFVDKKEINKTPKARAIELIDKYYEELDKNTDIAAHCTNAAEIEKALLQNKIAALLSVEGGEAVEGSVENLRILYRLGVRIMTLTWNYSNEICDGIGEARGGGLTEFGKSVVEEMNRLGMLIDVSHISVKGFWDVIELSNQPIVATHSNAKELCENPRNLDDEQIKAIFSIDGCVGINFYPPFVSGQRCTVEEIVNHIEYLLELGGENNIGFGSDFDGIGSLPDGICGVEEIGKIVDEMLRRGFREELIGKITHENFMRVIKRVLN